MWDNKAPLKLLKSMPKKLSKENLEKIQLVIDADKYKNSLVSGFDLCGMYAPFCRDCKKTSIYPCAVAYINMMKSDGMEVEIDAKPLEEVVSETAVTTEIPKPVEEEKVAEEKPVELVEEEPVKEPEEKPQPTVHSPVKNRIRIAVARKKL